MIYLEKQAMLQKKIETILKTTMDQKQKIRQALNRSVILQPVKWKDSYVLSFETFRQVSCLVAILISGLQLCMKYFVLRFPLNANILLVVVCSIRCA